MAKVLVRVPLVGLGRIVARSVLIERILGGENGRALVQIEGDVALEADGVAAIGAGSEVEGATTRVRDLLDGFVDRGAVEGLAITDCAVGADVVDHRGAGGSGCAMG